MPNIEKTKNQHYVPRCYLNRWTNERHQINVFNKQKEKEWISNVYDVACERFFYDISYNELSASALDFLHLNGVNPEEDEQFIEHFFSEQVEGEYANLLKRLIDKDISSWYEKNCFFISKENKFLMSICLVYQYIRTKSVRDSINDTSKCMEQWIKDMNCDGEIMKRYLIGNHEKEIIQGNMFFDINNVTELTKSFCSLTWILGINRTNTPLFTSDHPIGTYPHIKDPIMSMSGIRSRGVEVYFPLSPNHILIMWDAEYHTEFRGQDRKYVSITEVGDIERYNRLCAYNSGQFVFANEPGFDTVRKMLNDNSDIFSMPKITLSHGGKIYTPIGMENK